MDAIRIQKKNPFACARIEGNILLLAMPAARRYASSTRR